MCARLMVLAKLPILTNRKIQKAVTTLLCDTTQKRDFALPIAKGASRVSGPISRHFVAQILYVMVCAQKKIPR